VKILVIRLSSIGDIVLTTPVLRCIKEQIPGCTLHFAVKKAFLPVVEANPNIDQLHIFEKGLNRFVGQLKKERFDHIIDLHNNYRSFVIRKMLSGSTQVFRKRNIAKWLKVNLPSLSPPVSHVTGRYFEAVSALGVVDDEKGCEYYIPDEARQITGKLPVGFENTYLAAVVGGRYKTKQIPPEKLAEICRKVNLPVVLLGGPEDQEQAESVLQKVFAESRSDTNINPVINMCGKASLHESAALIAGSACVVTPDTGLMHIAAALGKKVVSVWGNTIPDLGMYPWYGSAQKTAGMSRVSEVQGLECRPCSKLGFEKCPRGHFDCMLRQNPDMIAEQVSELL
jgi:ADP-heptose:LPS heptosyltransferase